MPQFRARLNYLFATCGLYFGIAELALGFFDAPLRLLQRSNELGQAVRRLPTFVCQSIERHARTQRKSLNHTQRRGTALAFLLTILNRGDAATELARMLKVMRLLGGIDPKEISSIQDWHDFWGAFLKSESSEEKYTALPEIIKLTPKTTADTHFQIDFVLEQRCYEEALVCLEKAVTIDPASMWLWQRLAITRLRLKDFVGAEAAIEKAKELDSTGYNFAGVNGSIYMEKGHFSAAEHEFRAVLNVQPDNTDAHFNLAVSLIKQKRFDEAVEAHGEWYRSAHALFAEMFARQDQGRSRGIPAVIFAAVPKSGSEYILEVVADALDVPVMFPTLNTFPVDRFVVPILDDVKKGGAIVRLHADASAINLGALSDAGFQRIIVHVRDPRQIMLSWVHQQIRMEGVEYDNSRHYFDPPIPENFRALSFEQQIDWATQNYLPSIINWIIGWLDAARDPATGIQIEFTEFREMSEDPHHYFERFLLFYGFDPGALIDRILGYERESNRNFRLGLKNEWRDVLSTSQYAEVQNRMDDRLFEKFGWNPD